MSLFVRADAPGDTMPGTVGSGAVEPVEASPHDTGPADTRPGAAGLADTEMWAGIGRLICAWGRMACDLEGKIADLRIAAGDVRTVGARTRPGMSRLFAELRAIVSMRDRRGAAPLSEIAEIERQVQRLDRFRLLIVEGFTGSDGGDGILCRDGKNLTIRIGADQLTRETATLEGIGARLMAL